MIGKGCFWLKRTGDSLDDSEHSDMLYDTLSSKMTSGECPKVDNWPKLNSILGYFLPKLNGWLDWLENLYE